MFFKNNALLSVYHKEGIVEFARALIKLGWRLYASGGTAKHLKEAGVEVIDVATIVGGPILGHRVVTLSREVHAGILSRDIPGDIAEVEKLGIPWFGLVCVDLYPLEKAIAEPDATLESVLDLMDIGGPTMISAASKGQRIVICDPQDRQLVLTRLMSGEPFDQDVIELLAGKADFVISHYRALTAKFRGKGAYFTFHGKRTRECQYGENAWQTPAAFYSSGSDDPLALDRFELLTGTPPSYNNLCDLDRLIMTMTHAQAALNLNAEDSLVANYIALAVKHGNCCGAAYGRNFEKVLRQMIDGDLTAVMGGVTMANYIIDASSAEILLQHGMGTGGTRRLIDGIVAPEFSEDAIELLRRKKDKCRLLANPKLADLDAVDVARGLRFRHVRGGALVQPDYSFILGLKDERMQVFGERTAQPDLDLVFAWAIGSTSNSNTITLVKDGMLIGNGTGQQDRVGAAKLAVDRAHRNGHDTRGAVAYSDSFFPFPDGPQVLIDAGVGAILTSSGSVNDKATIDLCTNRGVTLYMIPDKVGRGFFGH